MIAGNCSVAFICEGIEQLRKKKGGQHMASWAVDTGKLRQQGWDLNSAASRLAEIENSIRNVGNLSGLSFSGKYIVQSRVNELGNTVARHSGLLRNMGTGLSSAASIYEQAEEHIKDSSQRLQDNWNSGSSDGTGNSFISVDSDVTGSGGGGGGGGRGGASSEKSDEDIVEGLIKAWLTLMEKGYKMPGAAFMSKALSYFDSLKKFFTGDMTGLTGASDFCSLAKNSTKLWDALYKSLKNNDPAGFLEKQFGKSAAGIAIIGSFLGLAGKTLEAFNSDSTTFGGKVADFLDAGAEGFGLGKSVYDFRHLADLKNSKGLYTEGGLWVIFGETTTSAIAQFIRSAAEYSADGVWDLGDTAATGIDGSVVGLEKMISSLTFNMISAETFGTSAEEISQNMKDWAGNTGINAGNYILQHSDLKEQYDQGNVFDRIGITAYATFMSWLG